MCKYIAILLVTFSGTVFADSYLCIPDAAGGVRKDRQSKDVEGTVFNVDQKWILTNEQKAGAFYEGKWVVKRFEYGVHFDVCEVGIYNKNVTCTNAGLSNNNEFFRFYVTKLGNVWAAGEYIAVLESAGNRKYLDNSIEMGNCSKI